MTNLPFFWKSQNPHCTLSPGCEKQGSHTILESNINQSFLPVSVTVISHLCGCLMSQSHQHSVRQVCNMTVIDAGRYYIGV